MLSYTVHALQIAIFARESIDLRSHLCQAQGQESTNEGAKMRNHLNKRHEDFIAGLPSYFRLGSTVGNTSTGPIAAIPVQQWMLHQQLWSLVLRIHRASLSSQDGRTSCQLLAQNIISTQAQITSTVRRLRFSIHQRNPSVQCRHCAARRLATLTPAQGCRSFKCPVDSIDDARDKIWEAIELQRTRSGAETSPSTQDPEAQQVKASAQRSIIALEALMKLKGGASGTNEESRGATSTATRPRGHTAESNSDDTNPPARKPKSPTSSQPTKPRTRSELDLSIPRSSPVPLRTGSQPSTSVLPLLANDPTRP